MKEAIMTKNEDNESKKKTNNRKIKSIKKYDEKTRKTEEMANKDIDKIQLNSQNPGSKTQKKKEKTNIRKQRKIKSHLLKFLIQQKVRMLQRKKTRRQKR